MLPGSAESRALALTRMQNRIAERLRIESHRKQRIVVVEPSPLTLPPTARIRRTPPRRPADQQPGYVAEFDASTIFYDTFHVGNRRIYLCGPPLSNLRRRLRLAEWSLNRQSIPLWRVQLRDADRTQQSLVTLGFGETEGILRVNGWGIEVANRVGDDDNAMFQGRPALLAKSKDNNLRWIRDWLLFHALVHGVDSLVLYNNNTTAYTLNDLITTINTVPQIEVAAIVNWPFKWGPRGAPGMWDSDFSQYGMLEHARRRFLANAAGVINTDIDELVVTEDGRTVFQHAVEAPQGYIQYRGWPVATVLEDESAPPNERSFADYQYFIDNGKTPNSTKWTIVSNFSRAVRTQWRVHDISGLTSYEDVRVRMRHYLGINTGWKQFHTQESFRPDRHARDTVMEALFDILFPK